MRGLLTAALLAMAAPAWSDEAPGYYLGFSGHYYQPDDARGTGEGDGIGLTFGTTFLGKLPQGLSLELGLFGSGVEAEGSEPLYRLFAADVGLRYRWETGTALQPFVVTALGGQQVEVKGLNIQPSASAYGALGLGTLFSIAPSWALRAEARGHLSFDDEDTSEKNPIDLRGILGLEYRFAGDAPVAEAAAPAAALASTEAPLDADQDGISDASDRCPDTVANVAVDGSGCAVVGDADGDGVADGVDRCPVTQANVTVDAAGCELLGDADSDGIANSRDQCPDTPVGSAVTFNGCPLDADGDGVGDLVDRCPNTVTGTPVDEKGCKMEMDLDGDGVTNPLDACPNTPKGLAVDSRGCVTAQVVVLNNVQFAAGKSLLAPESHKHLDNIALALKGQPALQVEIGGHTDAQGSQTANLTLSQSRAAAVRDYLIAQGIDGARLFAEGYGEFAPVADNATAEGRAKNRRVEFKIME